MTLKEKTEEIANLLDLQTTRTNRELILVAGFCTLVGIILGFIVGKTATNHSTIKKYNKCYSYDFGDKEE